VDRERRESMSSEDEDFWKWKLLGVFGEWPMLDPELLETDLGYGHTQIPKPYELLKPLTICTGVGCLENLGVGPGRITLIGGVPKSGKTDLGCQIALDALRGSPDLVALIASAELGERVLIPRQIARLSGVPMDYLLDGKLSDEAAVRVRDAQDILHELAGMLRLEFMTRPFNLLNVAHSADTLLGISKSRPDQLILVLDWIQLFSTVDRSAMPSWNEKAGGVGSAPPIPVSYDLDELMNDVAALASQGLTIIVVSRLNREGYDGASLGVFHGSAQLEYLCDNAFVLTRDEERPGVMILRHVASRDMEPRDRFLRFDGRIHRFTPLDEGEGGG
jgi:hypothetical protein